MVTKSEKREFAKRLNERLDAIGAPPEGQGRQEYVGRLFGVTGKGARKWMIGESMPRTDSISGIARILQCDPSWLLFGHAGGPRDEDAAGAREAPPPYHNAITPMALAVERDWQELPENLRRHHADLIRATLDAITR